MTTKDQGKSEIRRWGLSSAGVAPLLLVGGWTIAAARQPTGYNPIRDTISSLAARGAADRWVMSLALVGLGVCYALTGLALRPARRVGRVLLVAGGMGTVLVAAFPQPVHGNSVAHTVAATIAFTALALWPVFAASRRSGIPLLTRLPSVSATVVMAGLLVWFVLEVHGSHRGLAERAGALAEALWPLVIVVTGRAAGTDVPRHPILRSGRLGSTTSA